MTTPNSSPAITRRNPIAGVRVGYEAGHTVIWLWGEHDLASAPAIYRALMNAARNDDTDVVVDLLSVSFMDCSTVGALMTGRQMLHERSRPMMIRAAPRTFTRRVLALCGLEDICDPAATEQM